MQPKIIIGLGNPGHNYYYTRHNIGFRILDALAEKYGASWHTKENFEYANITIGTHPVLLVKPQTSMNRSGLVMSALLKNGISPADILVVHDELEKPFGKCALKEGGSHRGHNGIRSIIAAMGPDFPRLRFGIGRPQTKEEVPDYVLQPFLESEEDVCSRIEDAIAYIEKWYV
ncbi:MAG TPA: aminoacyl-tRNA hydrolase [Candidatus Bathyarchaeia archaeon]|nr:aminoacyl-tRNA hydrolase [Candidatus Bathyarchaeia archaeon]